MASNELLLQTLERIENKIDTQGADIASLKETRAESRGRLSAFKLIMGTSGLSAAVSYLTSLVHH